MNIERIVLEVMRMKAQELGIEGVAGVLQHSENEDYFEPKLLECGRLWREPRENDAADAGTNYWGVCATKMADMIRQRSNSGTKTPRNGETGYEGGMYEFFEKMHLYTAFSGGTEKQDLIVATAGMRALKEVVSIQQHPFTIVVRLPWPL